jgi:hypothetical protein
MDGDPEGLEQVGEGEDFAPVDASDRLSFIRHGRFSFSLFALARPHKPAHKRSVGGGGGRAAL